MLHIERRFEPFFRPAVDAVLREPSAALIQYLINRQRRDDGLGLAEEHEQPGEEQHLQSIIDTMAEYMRQHWQPGNYQRAGNTKTHGVVRGEVTIRDDLPSRFRHGVFAEPKTYRAWVRFSGPGPDWPRDIDDVGFVSCAIKLMGVPGPKLLDDETVHAGLSFNMHADVRNSRHPCKCETAVLDTEGTTTLLLRGSTRSASARWTDAVLVEQDAEQSIGRTLLELRALSVGRRAGDDVFGLSQVEGVSAHSTVAADATG